MPRYRSITAIILAVWCVVMFGPNMDGFGTPTTFVHQGTYLTVIFAFTASWLAFWAQNPRLAIGLAIPQILWNVGLPRTMPYFFASLKVAVTLAFVGTVISETVASNRGIGNVMMIASSNFDVPLVFAGLLILAVLGVALYAVFSLLESRITGWAHRKDEWAMG